jgi:hypothetical protein
VLLPFFARFLRLASIAICLIALASFAAFAIDETRGASHHQRAKVDEAGGGPGAGSSASKSKTPPPSTIHKAVDKVFSTLSSPFSGVTSGSSSQWTIHIVDLLLILLVYGFGLSFLARIMPGRL